MVFKKGYIMPKKWKDKIKIAKIGNKNPMWKGDGVGYHSLHEWVRRHKSKPQFCEICKVKPPIDLANRGIYNRDFKNWIWLCRKCHMKKDGRMKKLNNLNRNKRTSE